MSLGRGLLALSLFAIALTMCGPCAADSLTDRARALLGRGDAPAAYKLLAPEERRRAGNPEFDYLLGVSALDSGELERAVFALERVLAVDPDNAVARAEIARAYYAMGEREDAKREFESVRAQRIPDEAKETIDRFLSAIRANEVVQISGFFELGVGYDTNVNSATSNNQVAIPAFGGILNLTLAGANSTQRQDAFTSVSGGVNVTHKLSSEWAVVGGGALATKLNHYVTEFDTFTGDGNLGLRWARDKEAITLGAQYQEFELDWGRFRQAKGLVGQWQYNADEFRQTSLYAQYSELRYPSQSIRNADRSILGIAYGQAFGGELAPVMFASAYFGKENELAPDVPHLGHKPRGARLGVQWRVGAGWSALANASYEDRQYGGPEPIFGVTRHDRQSDFGAGLSYVVRAGTTLIAQFSHTENRSNIDLFQFNRTLYSLSLRFNF